MTAQPIDPTLQDQLAFAIANIPGKELRNAAHMQLHIITQSATNGLASSSEADRLAEAMETLQIEKLIDESKEDSLLAEHWKSSKLVDQAKAALTMSGSELRAAYKSAGEKTKSAGRTLEKIARAQAEPTEAEAQTCERILRHLRLPEYEYDLD